jgi:hypothetical protein
MERTNPGARLPLAAAMLLFACATAQPAVAPKPAAAPPAPAPAARSAVAPFDAFLEEPTPQNYLAARRALVASPAYDPYAQGLAEAEELVNTRRWVDALKKIADVMPNFQLTPRIHYLAGLVAEAQEDKAAVQRHTFAYERCLRGLLETGEGTEEKPYLVTRVEDEYDMLVHLEKAPAGQGLVSRNGKHFDVMRCTDGTEIWFDVSDAFANLQRKLRGS